MIKGVIFVFLIPVVLLSNGVIRYDEVVQGEIVAVGENLQQSQLNFGFYKDLDYDTQTYNSSKNLLILKDLKKIKYGRIYWWGKKEYKKSKIGIRLKDQKNYKYFSQEYQEVDRRYFLSSTDITDYLENIQSETEFFLTIEEIKKYDDDIDSGWTLIVIYEKEEDKIFKEIKIIDGLLESQEGVRTVNIHSLSKGYRKIRFKTLGWNNRYKESEININEDKTNSNTTKIAINFSLDRAKYLPPIITYEGEQKSIKKEKTQIVKTQSEKSVESGFFMKIGVGAITSKIESSWDTSTPISKVTQENTTGYLLGIGYDFSNSFLSEVILEHHKYDQGSTNLGFLNIQYSLDSKILGFNPYLVLGGGYGELKADFFDGKITGNTYSVGIGFFGEIFDSSSIDFGLKFVDSKLEGIEESNSQKQNIKYKGYTSL
ncbi:MAG: porin, partial [Campylobacterales bacterium]|nr:porin [Campylobacterales bacterium]